MSKEQLHEITLPLDDIQDLFADPEPDSDRFVSGMDYLYSEVRVHTRVLKRPDTYKVTIELPREKITEGLQERTSAKIKRYCKFKAEQSHKDLRVLRLQGFDALRRSIWVALISVVLGILASAWSQFGVNSILQAVLLFILHDLPFTVSYGNRTSHQRDLAFGAHFSGQCGHGFRPTERRRTQAIGH